MEKNVYVVTSGRYSDYRISGIFTTRELAEAFINAINEEWSGAMPFTIIYDKSGNVSSYWENIEDKTFFENAVKKAIVL